VTPEKDRILGLTLNLDRSLLRGDPAETGISLILSAGPRVTTFAERNFVFGLSVAVFLWIITAYLRDGAATLILFFVILADLVTLFRRNRPKGVIELGAGLTGGFLLPYLIYALAVVHGAY